MSQTRSQQFRSIREYFGMYNGGVFNHVFYDKEKVIKNAVEYMLLRTVKMFEWENLPETIPQKYLERYLQTAGACGICKVDGELYAFTGGFGGPPDPYYQPTIFTVANPALNFSAEMKIGKQCVMVRNDSLYLGLMPLCAKYATLLAETELSFFRALVSCRQTALISASDDRTYQSAQKYLADIEAGKGGVVSEPQFFDGVRVQPLATTQTTNNLTALIESEQYWLGRWFSELGIEAPYNMKREALNSAETLLNEDQLFPLVDEMLECREKGAKEINEMYGTNISVHLSSVWEQNSNQLEKGVSDDVGDTSKLDY